jgi:hypothetical protein
MLEGAIAFAVLAVLMFGGHYLYRRRSRPAPAPRHVAPTDGAFTLRTPRKNAVLLGVCALFPAVLVGMLTIRAWDAGRTGAAGFLLGIVATLGVLAFAAYQFASASRSALLVTDAGIERIGVFQRRLVSWDSISKIAFNPAQHWFFLTVTDGSHLWLPADIAGMGDFAVTALRRLPPLVLRSADPMVREVLDELSEGMR